MDGAPLHLAYIGLGTNLCDSSATGDRNLLLSANLNRALQALQEHVGTLLRCSSFLPSAPWGFESKNTFLNAVALIETPLSPLQLLHQTQQIERLMGRTTKSHSRQYHDRIIDLDILLYDDLLLASDTLTIPHPLMLQRPFVMQPLCEIAPTLVHPTAHKTIAELTQSTTS